VSLLCPQKRGERNPVPKLEERIASTRRHVEAGRLTIEHHRQMVQRFGAEGRDTKTGEVLLATLEHTHTIFERELADIEIRR